MSYFVPPKSSAAGKAKVDNALQYFQYFDSTFPLAAMAGPQTQLGSGKHTASSQRSQDQTHIPGLWGRTVDKIYMV